MKFIRKLLGLDAPKPPVRAGRDRDFDLRGLERILHYEFKDPALARQAMTHRSYLHATPGRSGESNERMEFLGDSVVGLVVNEFLYKKFTKLREGELTKMKSLLVSRVILSRSANQLGLGHYILLSEAEKGSGGRDRASILADTLEGIIGAMYLDGGIEVARKLTERLLLREVNVILSDANLANYKSMLQEYVQGEFKSHPQYRISSEYGPDHQKMFTVEVVVSGKTFGRGHGSNKKEAEQEAARDALFHFEKLARPGQETAEEGTPADAKRRRRRGGRGRRNGRDGRDGRGREGGSSGPEAASAAGGSQTGRRGGEHRERRERHRDRESGRERDTERGSETVRDSAPSRDREYPRDREPSREREHSRDREYPRDRESPRDREAGGESETPRDREYPLDRADRGDRGDRSDRGDREYPQDRGERQTPRDREPSRPEGTSLPDAPGTPHEGSDTGRGGPFAASRLHAEP
ncbi:MAG TPA: ribonuclease III [Candidatus Limnocylindrales bacterium]|nr:ribonuclease III [Candidatus Limnocylindrales bacterium]